MGNVKVHESWVRGRAIGKGSYGTVSLAVSKSSGAVFAVKSVDKSSSLPYQVEALENEIKILRSLSSPYVVEYLGDGVTVESPTGICFRNLHMEYLPGGTVADMARGKRYGADMDERIIKNYAFCIVSALRYLHSKGIVHCDIKGDNVLVGPTTGTAKLADFGASVEISPRGDQTKFKNEILPRGSPLWMAPEVVRGDYQGPESDVWSLGCTVIEMVTGKPAWEDKGPAETLCKIGYSDELPRLPSQLSELGGDFLEKCLRREPNQRWSCEELLQHPFISMSSPENLTPHSSPRCTLDCFNSDSDEEDTDDERVCTSFPLREETESESHDEICKSRVKDRIRELVSGTGAIGESEGWMTVRGLDSVIREEDSGAECCGDGGEGTSSAYTELMGIEGEIRGAVLEYADTNSIEIGEAIKRSNGEYYSDSNGSLSQEEQKGRCYDVDARDSTHHDWINFEDENSRISSFLFLSSYFSRDNYKICSQLSKSMAYIILLSYIYFSIATCLLFFFLVEKK